jgi:chorismate--pyruvate lyase
MEPVHVTKRPPTLWQAADSIDDLYGEPAIRQWLEDSGSLTRRLRRLGGRDFHLEVLGESWVRSGGDDLSMLGSAASRVRVRRVRLAARGIHLVFACTRMPPETLARHPWLGRLGQKPLGEALADRTDVVRRPFEFAVLPVGHQLLRDALHGTDIMPGKLWGRRSLFLIGESPILVYEVFLPGLASFGDR